MEYIKKNEWVRRKKGEIRVFETLIKALETLATSEVVKALNGKYLTKRVLKKIQPLMPENVEAILYERDMFIDTIDFQLYAEMDGLQDPKTLMYDHIRYTEPIYQYYNDKTNPLYLGKERIFNYDNFVICVQNRINNFKKIIAEYQLCIKNINAYQKAYAKMENVIKETMDKIPYPLKQYIHFTNPILND